MSDQKSVGSGNAVTSKTGRKGDPRMHRAVRARVENPKLSLFEALKAGGFDYPTDDDSSCIDAENVSLGQRKNQLSRRVRLARKHGQEPSPSQQSQSEFTPQQQQLQSLFAQHNKQLAGNKHTLLDEDQFNEEPVMEDTTDRARLMAKFHPQYHPIIVPRAGTSAAAAPQGVHHSQSSGLQQQAQQPLAASNFGLRNMGSQVHQQDPPGPQLMNQILPTPSPATQLKRPAPSQNQAGAPQTISSGVALASLQQTASSVGLTLEQLALSLQSSNTLSKVLLTSGNSTFKDHQDLALAFYQSENKALYQKSMLLAGYQPDDTREGSSRYLQFALAAWQSEGKRLDDLVASRSSDEAPMEAKTGPPGSGGGSHLNHQQFGGPSQSSQDHGHSEHASSHSGHQSHSSHHGHQHHSDHHQRHQASRVTQHQPQQHHHDHHDQHSHHHDHRSSQAGCCDVQGRHIHRLEGKCGHKAILHQPEEGPAHIDFVVGDTVECYHGVQPLQQQNSTNTSVWPSRFKCEDLSCPSSCTDSALDDHKHTSECSKIPDPKIINIQDIELGGKEWSLDFANDESLLGLFKLHETMTPRDLMGVSFGGSDQSGPQGV